MNRLKRYADEAGIVGITIVATLAVVLAFTVYFGGPEVHDQIDGSPRHEVTDLAMGTGLPEKGVGASPSTLFPRFTSTRTQVVWKPSVHWSPRGNASIEAIVVHVAGGRPDQCDGTANYLTKNDRLVSAHFLVCENKVFQQVEIGDAAHHAGIWGARLNEHGNPIIDSWWRAGVNPNTRTVGIETMLNFGYHIDNELGMRENLIEVLTWLSKELNLPPDRTHIIGHYEIDDVNRPSDPICCMDLDAIVAEVAHRVFAGDSQGVPIPTPTPETFPVWDGSRWVWQEGRDGGWSFDPNPEPWGVWYFKDVAIFDRCDPSWNGRRSTSGVWDHVGDWNFYESVGAWIQSPEC